jgi:CDP-2,3-bis-(O-geranylgeranyl)-sn-glycerol synthase
MPYDLVSAILPTLISSITFILPAWVANGAPVVFGGGTPLDFGRKIGGKRIFGSHKTVRGLVAGIAAGFIVSALESAFVPGMLLTGVLLTLGTHAGDLLGSLVKRRAGKEEGSSWPIFDQYLFLLFALAFALPLGNLPGIPGLLLIVVLTGVLHKATNIIAHKVKMKNVPW